MALKHDFRGKIFTLTDRPLTQSFSMASKDFANRTWVVWTSFMVLMRLFFGPWGLQLWLHGKGQLILHLILSSEGKKNVVERERWL